MKKLAFSALILFLILATSCERDAQKNSAINGIPVRSAIVVRINDLQELHEDLSESVPGKALQNSILFSHLSQFAQLVNAFNPNNTKTIRAFGGYDVSGAGQYGWVWSLEHDEIPYLNTAVLEKHGTLEKRDFGSSTIIHFTHDDFQFYVAEKNGIVLLSEQENLIEASLKQIETKIDLTKNPHFLHALKTVNGKDPANIFIQFKALPNWLETLEESSATWTENFATWSALDLDINANDINVTGISLAPDSTANYLSLFNKTGSGSNAFCQIIPQNTALAISQTCGNLTAWHSNFSNYLGKHNKLKIRNNKLTQLGVKPEEFLAFSEEEMGVFYSDGALPSVESKNGFIRVSDDQLAQTTLTTYSGSFDENYRGISIKQLNKKLALPLVFGRLFSHLGTPYWFVKDDFVIFSNNLANAKSTINNLLAEKTWATLPDFEGIESLRDNDAHIIAIARNPEWLHLVAKELKEEPAKNAKTNQENLANVNWVLLQFKQNNDAAYSELMLLHKAQSQANAKQYWSVEVGDVKNAKPQLVKNHQTRTNDVLVQDDAHQLHLINAKGETLWKVALDGPILGKVEQVDLFKNNKFQLVFTTAQKLYIIDRLGRTVAPFPVALPAKATGPVGVFDYDNTRNYRFVVPCGKQLINFGTDGKRVQGWDFKKAKSEFKTVPKHDVIGTKDYIYLADVAGNVYLLNRRGEIRLPIKSKMKPLASEMYLVNDKNIGGKLSALSQSGYVVSLLMSDAVDSIQAFGNKPKFMVTEGETQVFASRYDVYMRNDKFNFDVEVEEEIKFAPGLFTINGKLYVTVTTNENQVWVFNAQGNALPGMPLYGSTPATVGLTSGKALHVVVATEEGAIIDYKLEE